MNLLQMSFSGAVLILAVVVLRAVALNRLPKRFFLLLWELVLFRLLIPFSIPSAFSVYFLSEHGTPANNPAAPVAGTPLSPPAPAMPSGGLHITAESTGLSAGSLSSVSVWYMVWAVGMILCAAFFVISYLRCRLEFQTSLPVQNAFVEQWRKDHALKRTIAVRSSDKICAPLTYGIFRPVILMPKKTDWENKTESEYILSHEYMHIRHCDALLKLIMLTALCIHWLNPFVWVMYFLINQDIELACDERVIRFFGESSKADYARILIHMEAKQSGLEPFCSHFSKNALEERITAIMKKKKLSFAAILIAIIFISGVAVVFATSAPDHTEESVTVPNTAFSEEEYAKLLALRFDGYENMSVSDYRNRVWEVTDNEEYRNLLERFSQDETLYALKDKNDIASFLFYIVEPLSAEKWQTRSFGGYTTTGYPEASDNATLEFFYSLTIQDADALTVEEYNRARAGMLNGLQDMLQNKTTKQLEDNILMQEILQTELDNLTEKWNTNKLQIEAGFTFTPLSLHEIENDESTQTQEPRQYPYATQEDYRSLLALKTEDYRQMSVTDFNDMLLEWANADFDRSERIWEDVMRGDYQTVLSEEELAFVSRTMVFSNEENFRRIRSEQTGKPEEDATSTGIYAFKDTGDGAWCTLWYSFSHHIADKDKLTVGERDRCLGGVAQEITDFWEKTEIEDLLKMNENDVVRQLQEITAKYSNSLITVSIDESNIQFESLDERDAHRS